jgi:hypothetical protein
MFVPVAIETFGALGDEATAFLTELGRSKVPGNSLLLTLFLGEAND